LEKRLLASVYQSDENLPVCHRLNAIEFFL
jgi:hypothetical protein